MKQRYEWLDIAKGIGMLLVLLGHSPVPLVISNQISTFHMPLFFFLSGLVFKYSKYNSFAALIKTKAKTLLVPYVLFYLINYMFWALTIFIQTKTLNFDMQIGTNIKPYVMETVQMNLLNPIVGIFGSIRGTEWSATLAALWFLQCLFITEILYYALCKILNNNKKYMFILLLLISLIGYVYAEFLGVRLPWSIDAALIGVVFFGLGNFSTTIILNMKIKLSYSVLIFVILAITNIIFGVLNTGKIDGIPGRVDMSWSSYGNYFYFYLSAIAGILMIILVSKLINKSTALVFIGKNTLVFLGLHYTILFPTLNIILKLIGIPDTQNFYLLFLKGVFYTSITSVVLVPICKIINARLPFLGGGRIKPNIKQDI